MQFQTMAELCQGNGLPGIGVGQVEVRQLFDEVVDG